MGQQSLIYFLKRTILLLSACVFLALPVQAQSTGIETANADRIVTLLLGLSGIVFTVFILLAIRYRQTAKRKAKSVTSGNQEASINMDNPSYAALAVEDLDLNYQPISLMAPLREIAASYESAANNKDLNYTFFVSDDLDSPAYCDENYIRQCLKALIDNAIKFTDDGRVHVHITAEPSSNETLALQIIVADTGIGIKEDALDRLFTPPQTTGLNLLLARSLARNMGGGLTINSRAGRGTEITLTAVLTRAADASMPKSSSAPILDLMKLNPEIHSKPKTKLETVILIVEDVSANQKVLKSLLEPLGYMCLTAGSGEQAIEHLKDNTVDVILMDVHMPGIDGVETTRAIRQGGGLNKNTPIIAITADINPLTNSECLTAGADLFMTKPIKKSELMESITYLLGQTLSETA